MAVYVLLARMDQIVTKDVQLLVEADNEDQAKEWAKEALELYPAGTPYNPMIHRIVTKKAHHWIPKSIDFVEIEEEKNE